MTAVHRAVLLLLTGVALVVAGAAWLFGPPVALIVAGVPLIAAGLFAVDIEGRRQ